jgi:hypothetical protein
MIGHHFVFFDLGLMLFTHLTHNLFQSLLNRRKEHLPAIFRTPDRMPVAGIEHVPVALVSLAHTIEHTAFGYLVSRAFVLGVPGVPLLPTPTRNAPFIPMDASQGLSGAGIGKEETEPARISH